MLKTKILVVIAFSFRNDEDTLCIPYGTSNTELFWPFPTLKVITIVIALNILSGIYIATGVHKGQNTVEYNVQKMVKTSILHL